MFPLEKIARLTAQARLLLGANDLNFHGGLFRRTLDTLIRLREWKGLRDVLFLTQVSVATFVCVFVF